MRVLVTGAYGLIGSACLARLHRDGHAVVGAGRSLSEARRFPYARWVAADFARLTSAAAWRPLLADIDAVVNCVGVLQDSARDDTRRVHVEATSALFDACAQVGIRRVVHVSAIGAEREGPTSFSRSKAEAEAHLQQLDLDWVILRPALVLAPAVYGGTAMLRGLAGLPWLRPLIGADSRIQIVGIAEEPRRRTRGAARERAGPLVRAALSHQAGCDRGAGFVLVRYRRHRARVGPGVGDGAAHRGGGARGPGRRHPGRRRDLRHRARIVAAGAARHAT